MSDYPGEGFGLDFNNNFVDENRFVSNFIAFWSKLQPNSVFATGEGVTLDDINPLWNIAKQIAEVGDVLWNGTVEESENLGYKYRYVAQIIEQGLISYGIAKIAFEPKRVGQEDGFWMETGVQWYSENEPLPAGVLSNMNGLKYQKGWVGVPEVEWVPFSRIKDVIPDFNMSISEFRILNNLVNFGVNYGNFPKEGGGVGGVGGVGYYGTYKIKYWRYHIDDGTVDGGMKDGWLKSKFGNYFIRKNLRYPGNQDWYNNKYNVGGYVSSDPNNPG